MSKVIIFEQDLILDISGRKGKAVMYVEDGKVFNEWTRPSGGIGKHCLGSIDKVLTKEEIEKLEKNL